MSTVSPPKPWERIGGAANTSTLSPGLNAASNGSSTNTSQPPALPSRPNTLNSVVNQTASNYSNYGAGRLGTSGYGGYGGYSSYSSPYSRFGGMGGMNGMYGGGGYGGMYGGGMGGMGGMYGGGMGGMPGNPNDPNSLTNSFNQSTQATFQIIESIVGAFGGFAQMLESTYMATHSSFFAMVSVAEQFGNLRNTLGSVLGIFTLLRWLRTLVAKITGRPPPADATSLTPSAFASFMSGNGSQNGAITLPDGTPAPPRPSKKPFIMFLLAVFGLPYLMGKLIRALAHSQEAEEIRRRQQEMTGAVVGPNGQLIHPAHPEAIVDPSKLDFCRLLYDYTPPSQSSGVGAGIDLSAKKGDLVAVLSKTDPMGNPSEWWRCRARDGSVGYLPSPYLETIQRRQPVAAPQGQITAGSAPGSRTATLKTLYSGNGREGEGRSKSLTSVGVSVGVGGTRQPVQAQDGGGDGAAESFQKSAFYS